MCLNYLPHWASHTQQQPARSCCFVCQSSLSVNIGFLVWRNTSIALSVSDRLSFVAISVDFGAIATYCSFVRYTLTLLII